jgi:hypothetical protein
MFLFLPSGPKYVENNLNVNHSTLQLLRIFGHCAEARTREKEKERNFFFGCPDLTNSLTVWTWSQLDRISLFIDRKDLETFFSSSTSIISSKK